MDLSADQAHPATDLIGPDQGAASSPALQTATAPLAPPFDLSAVLVEVHGETGLLLGQALQDVIAWVDAPPEARAGLFGRGAAAVRKLRLTRVVLHPELATPVSLLVDLVQHPTEAHALLTARACLHVARHLCERGAGGAALAFAHAAALVTPQHPRPLLEVGRLLGPARADQALHWLERAAACADEHNDALARRSEIQAELAVLAFRRHDRRAARGHLLAAVRAGRRSAR